MPFQRQFNADLRHLTRIHAVFGLQVRRLMRLLHDDAKMAQSGGHFMKEYDEKH